MTWQGGHYEEFVASSFFFFAPTRPEFFLMTAAPSRTWCDRYCIRECECTPGHDGWMKVFSEGLDSLRLSAATAQWLEMKPCSVLLWFLQRFSLTVGQRESCLGGVQTHWHSQARLGTAAFYFHVWESINVCLHAFWNVCVFVCTVWAVAIVTQCMALCPG